MLKFWYFHTLRSPPPHSVSVGGEWGDKYMFIKINFENVIWDFLFAYRQFLLNGYLHKRVNHDAYEKNPATWNTLLLSLESGALLGLAKLLERKKDIGRPFDNFAGKTFDNKEFDGKELDDIDKKY